MIINIVTLQREADMSNRPDQTKMRAMVVPQAGAKFNLEGRDLPEPERHEVRIKVHACGVCHSDSITVLGLVPGIGYPRIPGHEVIGVVDALGADIDGWKVGEGDGVGWFGGARGYCGHCRRGNSFAWETIHAVTGVTRDGGYAARMLPLTSAMARVPGALDAVELAPLLCAGVTTFNTLRNCGAKPGDLVAVLGVGGLSHLRIQFAARRGFRTVAVNQGSGPS
jgi:D-arabinose 1-dehydrogenase-like Zn-dependent alcohol dehydrogenase